MEGLMDNTALEKYFRENVQMKRETTKWAVAQVGPIVDQLAEIMHSLDDRIPRKLEGFARVGSHYQGLKVKQADEFDFSVPIQGNFCPEKLNSKNKRGFKFDREV